MRASRASRASASLDARGEVEVLVASSSLFSSAEAGFCCKSIISTSALPVTQIVWLSHRCWASLLLTEVAAKYLPGQSSAPIQNL